MLSDTHPDAERIQIELLRKMTPAQRLKKAIDLTNAYFRSTRQAIIEQNPDLNAQALCVKCVEFHYGKQLAEQVREYLLKFPRAWNEAETDGP